LKGTSVAARYRLFVVVLLVALTVPRMTQRGMFGDGLIHATLARNLSIGAGSMWAPRYTATTYRQYFEHPPLGFVLEGLAFRVFGDHLFVERLFPLLMFGLTALVMVGIWRRLAPVELDWLPLLYWILPSIVTWAVINNMLEVTQALFTTAAVLALLQASRASAVSRAAAWAGMAGLGVVAAVLTKGLVGLFPIAVPLLLVLLPQPARTGRLALIAGATLGTVIALGLLLYLYEPARHSLTEYLRVQLAPSLQGQREINSDPFAVPGHLGFGVVARMLVIAALFWLIGWRRSVVPTPWRVAAFFLSIGLCASLPIAISPKIVGHYFLPSVPFFALAFAAVSAGPALALVRSSGRLARLAPVVLAVVLSAATIGVVVTRGSLEPRDKPLLRDLDAIATAMPRDVTIGACRSSARDFRLHSYVNRFWRVSLEAGDAPISGWLLQADNACAPPPTCRRTASGEALALFQCDSR
jgi:4-amino-4-deoxy-L-arabinose transferase-like glycosyltransferase